MYPREQLIIAIISIVVLSLTALGLMYFVFSRKLAKMRYVNALHKQEFEKMLQKKNDLVFQAIVMFVIAKLNSVITITFVDRKVNEDQKQITLLFVSNKSLMLYKRAILHLPYINELLKQVRMDFGLEYRLEAVIINSENEGGDSDEYND